MQNMLCVNQLSSTGILRKKKISFKELRVGNIRKIEVIKEKNVGSLRKFADEDGFPYSNCK